MPRWYLQLALALLASTAQAGGIYKWTDSAGRVHYGNVGVPARAQALDPEDMSVIDTGEDTERDAAALSRWEDSRATFTEREQAPVVNIIGVPEDDREAD